jgi:MFS family permease
MALTSHQLIIMGFFKKISNNVLLLGLVSFFTDVSSEMIFPLLPIFLTTYLGASQAIVGLIEGVADSAASLIDIFIGYFADRQGKYKRFVILGYGLSSLVKVGIAFATAWPQVLILRGFERLGKSIRSAPRDAIISLSSEKESRATAFGIHRMMDTLGAILGPLIAYLILTTLGSTESAYRTVFTLALIPALIAVVAIIVLVREPKTNNSPKMAASSKAKTSASSKHDVSSKAHQKPPFFKALSLLDARYRRFLLISGLFSLSYFSFALLLVRANQLGVAAQDILLLYLLYNICYAASSVPVGMLADRLGPKRVIAAAFILYGLVCLGFAFLNSFWALAALFMLYGLFVAADDSVNKAYISQMVGEKSRATALGAYSTAMGAVYLPANILFGLAWAAFGAIAAFGGAALLAFAAAGWFTISKK